MKHLKLYEDIRLVQSGDWVVLSIYKSHRSSEYINNSIGRIEYIWNEGLVKVNYDKMISALNQDYIIASTHNIVFHSKNREDCEVFLAQNKYNL